MKWLSVRNPLTKSEVDSVEKELGVSLPKDYKEQIGAINGGALKSAVVICQEGRIPYSRNVSLSKSAKGNIFQLIDGITKSHRFFPFATVGNGDFFCFDLKEKGVVLWLHDTNEAIYICDSFTQLMEMIVMK